MECSKLMLPARIALSLLLAFSLSNCNMPGAKSETGVAKSSKDDPAPVPKKKDQGCVSDADAYFDICTCGKFAPPVNIGDLSPDQGRTIFPFGVHSEGWKLLGTHGFEFQSVKDSVVSAPTSGRLSMVASNVDTGGGPLAQTIQIDLDCGAAVTMTLRADPSLAVGSRVELGQQIGHMVDRGGHFTSYFELIVPTSRDTAGYACPTPLFSDVENAAFASHVDFSAYPEKDARTVTFMCGDGTQKSFDFPAEGKLCQDRLPKETIAELAGCLSIPTDWIW